MTVSSKQRLKVLAALFNFPECLRDDLLEIPGFRQAFDLPTEAELTFWAAELRFLRVTLFSALRELYADRTNTQTVQTEDGRTCELTLHKDGSQFFVECKVGDQLHRLPGFSMASPQAEDRLAEFDRLVSRDNLHDPSALAWRERLAEGSLSDEELTRLMRELDQNPLILRQKIREQVASGETSILTLVPDSPAYYDRLIGASLGHDELATFVQGPCKKHIKEIMQWDFALGLEFALLVAGHSSISDSIDVGDRSATEVAEAFTWLADRGDRFSQVAGVELGVRLIGKYPGIEPSLIQMIEEMRDEDATAKDSRFALTASLFILVYGELSRRGLLGDKPPFWRRLAAMAQASLFERELVLARLDIEEFMEWATLGRGTDFFMQSLADLRIEPRWLPDFMSPKQLRDEAISRMVIAGEKLKNEEGFQRLRALLRGDGSQGLRSHVRYPQSFLPGPLEGNTAPAQALPAEVIGELRNQPESASLNSKALAGLVNSALVFRIEEEHSLLAAETLRKVRHQVAVGGSDHESFSLLIGLAIVAAVTRAVDLARDVRILARVLRRRIGSHLDADDLVRVGLIASAANREVEDWSQAVGEWFLEIAQEQMSVEDASRLRGHLRMLCNMVPELWRFCSKADAALAAVAHAA